MGVWLFLDQDGLYKFTFANSLSEFCFPKDRLDEIFLFQNKPKKLCYNEFVHLGPYKYIHCCYESLFEAAVLPR